MKRTSLTKTLTAFAVATLLAITSCGNTIAGMPGAATTLSTSSAASTTEMESTTTEESPSETTSETDASETTTTESAAPSTEPSTAPESSADVTDSAASTGAGEIDAASVKWISAFCTGFADIAKHTSPKTTGMSKSETIKTVVDAYKAMADAATAATGELSKVGQPSFTGNKTIAPAIRDWLRSVTAVYGQGSKTVAKGTYAAPSDLTDAINKIEAEMDGANNDLGAIIGTVDPSVSATIVSLPECAALASGG